MNPTNFQVDIVASRDLVRGFQRRLRTILPVPNSKLMIDLDDLDPYTKQQQQRAQEEHERELAHMLKIPSRNKSPATSARGGGSNSRRSPQRQQKKNDRHHLSHFGTSDAFATAQSSSSSSSSSKPAPHKSLHDSLVAAVREEQDSRRRDPFTLLSASSASSPEDRSPASTSFVDPESEDVRLQEESEQVARRLDNAYRQHREELSTKWYPDRDVRRCQKEILPVILERDCNARMRRACTSRTFLVDTYVEPSSSVSGGGSGSASAIGSGSGTPTITTPTFTQQQQRRFSEARSAATTPPPELRAEASQPFASDASVTFDQSSTATSQQRRHHHQQQHQHRASPKPAWTFCDKPDPRQLDLLHKRQQGVSPPRPHHIPTPRQHQRLHASPVPAPSSPVPTMPPSVCEWQVCYDVQ